jgi:hypothetical protein
MRLQNLVLTTNVAGIKILTCTNDDIMDNMKLYEIKNNHRSTEQIIKILNNLKGHTIINFNKEINNKHIIELKLGDSLLDFEKKYVDIV